MRIRRGFVSNSSSSSFVLVLDSVDAEGVRAILTEGTPEDVVQCVLRDITGNHWGHGAPVVLAEDNLRGVIRQMSRAEDPYDSDLFQPPSEFYDAWAEYLRGERDWASLEQTLCPVSVRELMERFPGKILASVSYADEDGDWGCRMEHGPHWEAGIKSGRVIRTSHH